MCVFVAVCVFLSGIGRVRNLTNEKTSLAAGNPNPESLPTGIPNGISEGGSNEVCVRMHVLLRCAPSPPLNNNNSNDNNNHNDDNGEDDDDQHGGIILPEWFRQPPSPG